MKNKLNIDIEKVTVLNQNQLNEIKGGKTSDVVKYGGCLIEIEPTVKGQK